MSRRTAVTVAVAVLAATLFASPARLLWARADSPWFVPYAVWGAMIALGALAVSRGR